MNAIVASDPADLVSVCYNGDTLSFWPHVNSDLSTSGTDPINLVFTGSAAAANIRAALLSVTGSRPAPFDAFKDTWSDAIGRIEGAYVAGTGWTGSVIQLECGSYGTLRFHLRLFPAGAWTLGSAHFEFLLPGTGEHQVLSWELGEQLVLNDLQRAGFVREPPSLSDSINSEPYYGEIPVAIYNKLPTQLRQLSGGPLQGDVKEPVGIRSNGRATIISLLDAPPRQGSETSDTLQISVDAPKPFCNAGNEKFRFKGLLEMRQRVDIDKNGKIETETELVASMTASQLMSGQPGPEIEAHLEERYRTEGDSHGRVFSRAINVLKFPGVPQELTESLTISWQGSTGHERIERCTS